MTLDFDRLLLKGLINLFNFDPVYIIIVVWKLTHQSDKMQKIRLNG